MHTQDARQGCAGVCRGYQGRAGVSVGCSGDFQGGDRRMFGCYGAAGSPAFTAGKELWLGRKLRRSVDPVKPAEILFRN